jgi:glutathione S-transferase
MSKKMILYTFPASIWGAVGELALLDLEYPPDSYEFKQIDLVNGHNFKPEFLKINPNATLPTLEGADGNVYKSTTEVTDYLVKNAPVKVAPRTDLTDLIHEDKLDPNFAFLLARNEDELKGKAGGFPFTFVNSRQETLNKLVLDSEAAAHKDFYDAKIKGNGGLLAIYKGEVPEESKQGFFKQSQAHWEALRHFILNVLPSRLPESGFLGGERPGEDDFHVGAWMARIGLLSGAKNEADGALALKNELGQDVPPKVVNYWKAWTGRKSWQQVYKDGVH